jgi:uncharacterized SAM-binding protein YcdF (DUF218 family)
MRKALLLLLVGLGAGLAWQLAPQLSGYQAAVLCGIGIGIAASLPTSLLLIALLRRAYRPPAPPPPPPAAPRVVLLLPPPPADWPAGDPRLTDRRN